MNVVPANINIARAQLPASYERAKASLAECVSLDECMEWANKAQALASYARQADDDTLRKHAERIQARATRRCGELLKQFDGKGNNQHSTGTDTKLSQKAIAASVGISKRQKDTAVRIANIPREKFEAEVEERAPTVTKLAAMGINGRPKPEGFGKATHVIGMVKDFANFCSDNEPKYVAGGVLPHEVRKIRECVSAIDTWLDRFVINLKD